MQIVIWLAALCKVLLFIVASRCKKDNWSSSFCLYAYATLNAPEFHGTPRLSCCWMLCVRCCIRTPLFIHGQIHASSTYKPTAESSFRDAASFSVISTPSRRCLSTESISANSSHQFRGSVFLLLFRSTLRIRTPSSNQEPQSRPYRGKQQTSSSCCVALRLALSRLCCLKTPSPYSWRLVFQLRSFVFNNRLRKRRDRACFRHARLSSHLQVLALL